MTDGHTDPPTGHKAGLGQGVKLDPGLLGVSRLEQARRQRAVELDLEVNIVVANDDPVPQAKGRHRGETLQIGGRGGWVAWIDRQR